MSTPFFPRASAAGSPEVLAAEIVDDGAKILRQAAGFGGVAGGVNRIGEQRMADMGHMDTDLMGAAGLEFAGDASDVPAFARVTGFDRIMGDGFAAVLAD